MFDLLRVVVKELAQASASKSPQPAVYDRSLELSPVRSAGDMDGMLESIYQYDGYV